MVTTLGSIEPRGSYTVQTPFARGGAIRWEVAAIYIYIFILYLVGLD